MFQKILYPTDFSDVSQKALAYIKQLKDSGVREVLVLHVLDSRTTDVLAQHMANSDIENLLKNQQEETRRMLKEIESDLKKAGLKVTTRTIQGIPVQEILKAEKEADVSAIVIGSHGTSNLKEMFMGSVSEKVIRKCSKPVLVIKR